MRALSLSAFTALAFWSVGPLQAQTEKSLYERLGGKPAIAAVVNDFVGAVGRDKRISGFFAKADIGNLKTRLVEQICAVTGGPCSYGGRDMKAAHAGLGIRAEDFSALVEDLGATLNKRKIPKKEQSELVSLLAPLRDQIVTR